MELQMADNALMAAQLEDAVQRFESEDEEEGDDEAEDEAQDPDDSIFTDDDE